MVACSSLPETNALSFDGPDLGVKVDYKHVIMWIHLFLFWLTFFSIWCNVFFFQAAFFLPHRYFLLQNFFLARFFCSGAIFFLAQRTFLQRNCGFFFAAQAFRIIACPKQPATFGFEINSDFCFFSGAMFRTIVLFFRRNVLGSLCFETNSDFCFLFWRNV